MNQRQIVLISAAIALTPAMFLIVPVVTRQLDPLLGYLAVLTIYWACFCIPIACVFGHGDTRITIRPSLQYIWIPIVALALPALVFFVTHSTSLSRPSVWIIAVAVHCALINGSLEELAWRRTFRANSNDNLSFEFYGLLLFTLWHAPLYFSNGVEFDHGAIGLIGGALIMGSIWVAMTRASNSIGWPAISHTLVNIVAFVPFFAANFG